MSDQDVIENPNHRTVVPGRTTSLSAHDGNMRSGPSLRESVSKRSNSPHGFSTYVRNFRSVLHHPVGLPLIRAFHTKTAKEKGGGGGGDGDGEDEKKKEEFPLIKEYFPDFFEGRGGSATAASATAAADGGADPPCATAATAASATAAIPVDDIFQSCHILWRSEGKPTELALTKKLAEAMASSLREYNVAVRGEAPVPDPRTFGTARIDVLVSKRMKGVDGTEADRPLLVVEVGLDNKLWRAKVDQSLKYMKYTQYFRTSDATLLSVVTLEEVENQTAARLGVFLVTPKVVQYQHNTADEFRVSLLWHDETERIGDLSRGFGRILRATCQLPRYIVAGRAMLDRHANRYLGPNCCLIEVKGSEKVDFEKIDSEKEDSETVDAEKVG
jgi:hypothetical protein